MNCGNTGIPGVSTIHRTSFSTDPYRPAVPHSREERLKYHAGLQDIERMEVQIADLIRFVAEDAPAGDVTSEILVEGKECRAVITANEGGTIAGLTECGLLFSHFGVRVLGARHDGEQVEAATPVMELEGDAAAILLVERTALNLIGRMSGIATRTRTIVDAAQKVRPGIRIAATRKTCPGLRFLDKKAVVLGGGDPHRTGLSDMFLIKDNHLALISLDEAVRRAKSSTVFRKIEVEVNTPGNAVRAAAAGADIVMLDNVSPNLIKKAIEELKGKGLRERIVLEASGGIQETNLAIYAALDLDVLSLGILTHSVKNFDVSLEVQKGAKSFNL
jgi:nicotinate-nucleotide pyrophosphorylase (carboxylating)